MKYGILIGVLVLVIAVVPLLLFSCRSYGRKPGELYDSAQEKMEKKDYPGALEDILKSYELSFPRNPEAFAGVRNSFLLSTWVELGKSYPPAVEAMRRVRDEKEHLVRSGDSAAVALCKDIQALDSRLGQPEKTVALFEFLRKKDPELAKVCWPAVRESVLETERYDLAGQYVSDYAEEFRRLLQRRDFLLKNRVPRESANDGLIKGVVQLVRLALAEGRKDDANMVLEFAGAAVSDPRIEEMKSMVAAK